MASVMRLLGAVACSTVVPVTAGATSAWTDELQLSSCDADTCRLNISPAAVLIPKEQLLIQRHVVEHTADHRKQQLLDSVAADQVRMFSRDARNVAGALQKGFLAIKTSTEQFTATPPRVLQGFADLGKMLLVCVEMLLPSILKQSDKFQRFRNAWQNAFETIPDAIESIKSDIKLFIENGDGQFLVRAIASVFSDVGGVVVDFLPPKTAVEVNKYLDAIADTFDAMGSSWGDFADGKAVDGVESLYWGLRSVTDALVPDDVKNNEAYDTIVQTLDVVLGSLSKTVLEYERRIMEASVCWRVEEKRDKERPTICPDNYVWDGASECYPTSETSTTTASADVRDDYEHFKKGSCRGRHGFDNPGDYRVAGFKGTLEKCLQMCSDKPLCRAAEYKTDEHCELWEIEPTTTWFLSFRKACYKHKQRALTGRPVPARCEADFPDKHGHYCYASCPAGSQTKEKAPQKCISACTGKFPAEAKLMCGRNSGMLAKATLEMVTVVLNSAFSLADNIKKMKEHGVKGELLSGTIQTFIDMGRPFANPTCPK